MDLPEIDACLPRHSTDILLLAHAPLASAYVRVAADMGLATASLLAFDMPPEMSREHALANARMLVADRPPGQCLILVDLGGATSPYAVAQLLQQSLGASARVVTGLNSAMLVTALCHSQLDVDTLACRVARRGSDGIGQFPPPSEQATIATPSC